MSNNRINLKLIEGIPKRIVLNIVNLDETPVDITGADVRSSVEIDDLRTDCSCAVVEPLLGRAECLIPPILAGAGKWDLFITMSNIERRITNGNVFVETRVTPDWEPPNEEAATLSYTVTVGDGEDYVINIVEDPSATAEQAAADAKKSADSATKASVESTASASKALVSKESALAASNSATSSASKAKASADLAKAYDSSASAHADNAKESATQAGNESLLAKEYSENAKGSEEQAKAYATSIPNIVDTHNANTASHPDIRTLVNTKLATSIYTADKPTFATKTELATKVNSSLIGKAGGVASLDSSGLVPSNQLPSYVDDVLAYNTLSLFPTIGESDKIYLATDTGNIYRWGGVSYVRIANPNIVENTLASDSTTNALSSAMGKELNSSKAGVNTENIFSKKQKFNGLVEILQGSTYEGEETHKGQCILNGITRCNKLVELNGSVHVNSPITFNNNSEFFGVTRFRRDTAFEGITKFSGDVTFSDYPTFWKGAEFYEKIESHGDSIFKGETTFESSALFKDSIKEEYVKLTARDGRIQVGGPNPDGSINVLVTERIQIGGIN